MPARLLLCLLLALSAQSGPATAAPLEAAGLMRQARAKALERHPYWLRLLRYRQVAPERLASEIISPEFFLSPQGTTDPAAELAATLEAFVAPLGDSPDAHARCRFPGRYRWLRKVLDWDGIELPQTACPQYNAFAMNGQVESLSLIYATGYLSNPASFYGHILLKFNTRRSAVAHDLLDQAVNFGANIPRDEGGVTYVLKGLLGGYDATFSHQQFYHFNHAYAENELRDMWEYRLELSLDEVHQIVSHAWELLGKKYVYYFLKENCAYRMAELLELVIDEPLLPALPYALPGTVFERLSVLRRAGTPVVREVRRIPSRQNRFRGRFLAMSEPEQEAAQELAAGGLDVGRGAYAALPEAGRTAVIDTLIDYYEYRIVADRKDAQLQRAKQRLLVERVALPAVAREEEIHPAEAAPPHEGPLPFMLRAGAIRASSRGGALLRLRPVNYDSLGLDAGRIPDSTLTMFDLELVYLDDRLSLRRLDLVRIETFNVAKTPLPGDGGLAWRFQVGLASQDLGCGDCTVFKLEGGLGKALSVASRASAFAMLDLSAQSEHANSETLAATPRLGLIATPARGWKTALSLGRQTYLNGARSAHRLVHWENRLGSRRELDFRVEYERHVAHELRLAVSRYW